MSELIAGILIGVVICGLIYGYYIQDRRVNKIQKELRDDGKTIMSTKEAFGVDVMFHDTDCVAVIIRKVGDIYEIASTQKSTEMKKVK